MQDLQPTKGNVLKYWELVTALICKKKKKNTFSQRGILTQSFEWYTLSLYKAMHVLMLNAIDYSVCFLFFFCNLSNRPTLSSKQTLVAATNPVIKLTVLPTVCYKHNSVWSHIYTQCKHTWGQGDRDTLRHVVYVLRRMSLLDMLWENCD